MVNLRDLSKRFAHAELLVFLVKAAIDKLDEVFNFIEQKKTRSGI